LTGRCSQGIENSLSLQLVAASILIFSTFARQQSVLRIIFQRAVDWIFVFQKSVGMFREKGKFDGTSKKFGLSHMTSKKLMKVTISYSRHYGSFENVPKL
jgi:hypothetical protein